MPLSSQRPEGHPSPACHPKKDGRAFWLPPPSGHCPPYQKKNHNKPGYREELLHHVTGERQSQRSNFGPLTPSPPLPPQHSSLLPLSEFLGSAFLRFPELSDLLYRYLDVKGAGHKRPTLSLESQRHQSQRADWCRDTTWPSRGRGLPSVNPFK